MTSGIPVRFLKVRQCPHSTHSCRKRPNGSLRPIADIGDPGLAERGLWAQLSNEGGRMAKLFLSYSRRDVLRATRFAEWLEREGHDVWRDDDDISGGASFSSEIEAARKDCDAVLRQTES